MHEGAEQNPKLLMAKRSQQEKLRYKIGFDTAENESSKVWPIASRGEAAEKRRRADLGLGGRELSAVRAYVQKCRSARDRTVQTFSDQSSVKIL